jgi:hypothetical protein
LHYQNVEKVHLWKEKSDSTSIVGELNISAIIDSNQMVDDLVSTMLDIGFAKTIISCVEAA